METDELRDTFHSFFNKINNIFTAVGANKIILQENLEALSSRELKERIDELVNALMMIEKNILALNNELQKFYATLKAEKDLPVSDISSNKQKK